jgi:hypothetical protein
MKKLAAAALIALLVFWVMLLAGCGESRQPYVGTYRSVQPFAGKGHVELDLKENGEATWNLTQEGMVSKFKWKVEGNQIWFYTRDGGIIIATSEDNGRKLNVDLSGQWHASCPVNQCITFERVKAGGS